MNKTVKIIDGTPVTIYEEVVHRGVFDDYLANVHPDFLALELFDRWKSTESGQWIMRHAVEKPCINYLKDISTFTYDYVITAKMKAEDMVVWGLQFK